MSAETDKLVRNGIKAYRAGRKTEARMLLEQATDRDPENEQAWMWLSAVVDSEEDQRICLENVLFLNPNNENARRGLKILDQKTGSTGPLASEKEEDDVFANSSFTSSSMPASQPPASSAPPTATSSASSVFQPEETDPEVYDDWVAGLNIGGQSSKEESYEEDQFLDDFTNVFASGFEDDSDAGNARLDSLMADDDLLSGPFSADVFTADPFSTDEYDATPARKQSIAVDEDDDDFDPLSDDFLNDPSLTAVKPSPPPPSTNKERRSPTESKRPSSSAFVNDYNSNVDELDPGEYFRAIPDEIRPTRLPGVNESYGVPLILGLILLLILNIGAAGLLAMSLS